MCPAMIWQAKKAHGALHMSIFENQEHGSPFLHSRPGPATINPLISLGLDLRHQTCEPLAFSLRTLVPAYRVPVIASMTWDRALGKRSPMIRKMHMTIFASSISMWSQRVAK
mmetsp:Transcript_4554/g.10528  ORF Transcript_4554/g.10528 Transcript_4554/m.10528 type:complete len:112 (+) Transcript_4554:17-352(+)